MSTTMRRRPPAGTPVTSIAELRSAARRRSEAEATTKRTVSVLLGTVAALLVIGVAATTSASSAVGIAREGDQWYFLKRQLLGIGLGIVAMGLTYRIDYRWLRRLAMPLFWGTLALLVAVLAVGRAAYGSQRWISLGPVSFQPSELAKLAVVVTLAAILERKGELLADRRHFLGPLVLVVGSLAGLVMLQPDLGTTIVVAACGLAVLWASAAPARYVLATGGIGALAAGLLAVVEDYRFDRIRAFMDPWADPGGIGYQLIQSYYALGTGNIVGVGLGASRARWFYLPNAHTDFIFSIIGEETGFIGAMAVVVLYGVLTVAGWSVAVHAVDPFGRMVAAGITCWLSLQAIVNIGGVTGMLPITGITLPFISYGGSAVAVTMAAVGILANIAQPRTG